MSTLDELKAVIATKDAQIAMLEWALATLSAERKTEVAELEAIKASLAAKAAHETDELNSDQPSVSQVVISPAMKARIVGTVVRPEFQVDYNADMLQDAGDGAYTV